MERRSIGHLGTIPHRNNGAANGGARRRAFRPGAAAFRQPTARLAGDDRAPLPVLARHRGDMDCFALEQTIEAGSVGEVVDGRLAQSL